MAESGDLIKEFKEAKPPEKAVIIGGILAIVGIAWYLHAKSQSNQNTSNTGAAPTSQTAGYPMAGNSPVVPSGTNPLFDPSGNLIGWQNPPPGGTPMPPPGPPTPTGQPANWFTNLLGTVGYGTHINVGGIDANGQRFWTGPNSFFYAPPGSQINYGAQGRVWITPKGGTQQLLTGPGNPGFAQPGPSPTKQLTQVATTAAQVQH